MRKHAWLLTNLVICAAMVVAGYAVVVYRQNILDWWTLRGYKAPADIALIASQDSMVGQGRDMFYVSQPDVEDSTTFNLHCSHTGEKTVVLGCYVGQRIYVYNVTDARLDGVKQVTAAHEMLHAAYERLDTATKNQVNAWLQEELPKVTDARLQGLIAVYNKTEPGELLNEMHSILGTEYSNLSPQLENYYRQYFSDRGKVVAYASAYEATFTDSQTKIAQIEAQLTALKKQVDANTDELTQQKAQLDAENAQLSAERSTNPAAYNAAVPGYNAQARAYNNLVLQTRRLIDQYNNLVVEHNNEATAQNGLYQSLDSTYQTVN